LAVRAILDTRRVAIRIGAIGSAVLIVVEVVVTEKLGSTEIIEGAINVVAVDVSVAVVILVIVAVGLWATERLLNTGQILTVGGSVAIIVEIVLTVFKLAGTLPSTLAIKAIGVTIVVVVEVVGAILAGCLDTSDQEKKKESQTLFEHEV
jgi:hypothetical protein